MRIISLPKKAPGEYRKVYIPQGEEMTRLKMLVGPLTKKASNVCQSEVVHGFMPGRNPVTNALKHVGFKYTLCFDLADFFESVTPDRLRGLLSQDEMMTVFVDGAARQGLPTSPPVSNIAAAAMDKAILKKLSKVEAECVYTRYADDLSFSFNDPSLNDQIRHFLPEIVGRNGFRINPAKTRIMCAISGRRHITGVAVDDAIHPTRHSKRRLRAARHQDKRNVARGLGEWCALKKPLSPEEKMRAPAPNDIAPVSDSLWSDAKKLAKLWGVRLPGDRPPAREDFQSGDLFVTGDPAYILGMSTYTNGWTSCLRQPDGQYRGTVLYWLYLSGARVAMIRSEKTISFAGVCRRKMRARALLYTLRDGTMVYDKIYGNPGDKEKLESLLKSNGYISVQKAKRRGLGGTAVRGNVLCRHAKSARYFDSLRVCKATRKHTKQQCYKFTLPKR